MRWTPQAVDDLEAIVNFVSLDSLHYARLVAIDITTRIEQIVSFPLSGRIVPEVNHPSIREVIIGSYRIVYRINKSAVEVLTIWHGARLLDPSRLL